MLLIIDDDPSFLQSAEALLGRVHDGVMFAIDAEQACFLIDILGAQCSMAMVDLDLAGRSGFELIRELRQKMPRLPIIAISGVYRREALESAMLLGAAEVLSKPLTPEWAAVVAQTIA